MIPLPKVLDHNGNETRRIRPVSLSINEKIVPLSTATMLIRKEDELADRAWVMLYSGNGTGAIYRARVPEVDYSGKTISVNLEHGICEVGDYVVREKADKEQKTLAAAVQHYFSFYPATGGKWQLGTVSATGNVIVSSDYQNLLSAIIAAVRQIPSAMMDYDFTTTPWTLNIRDMDANVSAEGRLGRNIRSAKFKRDDSALYTRVWLAGLGTDGAIGSMDADAATIAEYGIIETTLTGNEYTQAQAQLVASTYLERHKRPVYTVTIDGKDLSDLTGESLDRIQIGKKYRLAIPEENVVIEENVTAIRWDNIYDRPGSCTVTIAEQEETVISFLTKQAQKTNDNYASLESTVSLVSADVTAEVTRATGAEGGLSSRITQTSDAITAEVTRATGTESSLSSRITQTAESITAEVTRATGAESSLSSRITQTAEAITAEVTRATGAESSLSSRITQTAEAITAEVTRATGAESSLSSRITQTAEAITAEVTRAETAEAGMYQKQSGIEITANGITLSSSSSGEGQSSSSTVTIGPTGISLSGASLTVAAGNFSVSSEGVVTASKFMVEDENGQTKELALKTAGLWKLAYATVKSITKSADGGTLTITTTAGTTTFNGAASGSLDGSWSGQTLTVDLMVSGTAVSGKSWTETFTDSTGTGNLVAGKQVTINTFDSNHLAYGLIQASSLGGGNGALYTFNVDASSVYESVTVSGIWSGGTYTARASNGKSSVSTTVSGSWSGLTYSVKRDGSVTITGTTVSLTGGTTWTNNKTTVYLSASGVNGYLDSVEVDASSVYESVTVSGIWSGGTYTARASNGKSSVSTTVSGSWSGLTYSVKRDGSVTITGTTVSLTGGTTWTNNKTTVYLSASGVTGYLDSVEVDASSVYESVTVSGIWSGGTYTARASNGKSSVSTTVSGSWSGLTYSVKRDGSVTITGTTVSLTGGTTWTNNKTTVYLSASGVNGYLDSVEVDASTLVSNAITYGWQLYYDTNAWWELPSSDNGLKVYIPNRSATGKTQWFTISISEGTWSWSFPAQGYIGATCPVSVKINGNTVQTRNFQDFHSTAGAN